MLNITLEPQLETIRFVPQLTVIIRRHCHY